MCLGYYGGNKGTFDLITSKASTKNQRRSSRFSIFSNSKRSSFNKRGAKNDIYSPDVIVDVENEEEDDGEFFEEVGSEYAYSKK